jgi:hypothetical protein
MGTIPARGTTLISLDKWLQTVELLRLSEFRAGAEMKVQG